MPGPSVFEFETLTAFLQQFSEHKRQQSATWSFGVWARQLGLEHTATLTRVVNGDRSPGDQLSDAFTRYFAFQGDELRYWDCLVHRARSGPDERIRSLLDERMRELRARLRSQASLADAPLSTMEGRCLSLQGLADLERTTAFLAKHQLRPLAGDGKARIAIAVAHYDRSSAGPYCEMNVGFLVYPNEDEATGAGILFPFLRCDNSSVASHARLVWGHHYQDAKIQLADTEIGWSILTCAGESLQIRGSGRAAAELSDYQLDVQGFSRFTDQQNRYRFVLRSRFCERPFDPQTDRVDFSAWPELDSVLKELSFRPALWAWHENLRCEAYRPNARTTQRQSASGT